jgi:hypothetical protein
LTTTKNKDYYNSVLIEPSYSEHIKSEHIKSEPINEEPTNSKEPSTSKDLNNDFTYEMKNELNNFISKIKT